MALFGHSIAGASEGTYKVQSGDNLYTIGQQYGVSVLDLQAENEKQSTEVAPGETLKIPASITADEKDLLARIVHAEAKGEPYAGKVAVATVVLNRVDHPEYPNTIRGVIEEISASGHYAFEPVQNGEINRAADKESKRAANEALAFRGQGQGSIFFYNPTIATNHWIATRTETIRIGQHVFAK